MLERRASDSDEELLRALSEGSSAAMAVIYQLHGGLVYRFSLRMLKDEAIAEEVTQEVFLALLKQHHRFDPARASLSTWLCGIARRLVWKQLELRDRHAPIGETESRDDGPAVALDRKEAVLAVQRGISQLPPDLQAVIVLCEFEEMKYEDAADVLGVPVGTVRSRLHRAKARLALRLQENAVPTAQENKQ